MTIHSNRTTRRSISLLCRCCALFVLAGMAMASGVAAETVVLRSGLRMRITGYERLGELMRLQIPGGVIEIRADEIADIEPEDYFPIPATFAASSFPFADHIRAAAIKHGIDEDLITSVIAAESNFNPRAVSPKGAQGLMQLMPATAIRLWVDDAFDPAQNINGGTAYLKELLARYDQDLSLALAAYNAGPERVDKRRGIPPIAETRAYVQRVIRKFNARKQQTN